MHEHDEQEEELALSARVCQTCQQPFALIAKSDEEHLALHTKVMQAIVAEWQLPGYLVLPNLQAPQHSQVIVINPSEAPQRMTQAEFGEAQEEAFLRHKCVQP